MHITMQVFTVTSTSTWYHLKCFKNVIKNIPLQEAYVRIKLPSFFSDPGPEAMPGVMKEADFAVQRSQDRIKQNTETIII